jgi:hypothetical protein
MKPSGFWVGIGIAGLAVVLLVLGPSTTLQAQGPARDVGLVTKLEGEVTYWNESFQRNPAKAEAFMKVRQGDRFKVEPGGLIQVVYFQSSQQEVWRGPAAFVVGDGKGQAEGDTKAKPEVTDMPAGASQGVQRIPALLRRAGLSRTGAMQVRGLPTGTAAQAGSQTRPGLTPEEQSEVAAAKETYKGLRQKAKADDVTPELYLLGVLADYEQYEEMESVLKDAQTKLPGNDVLQGLADWVTAQKAKAAKP